MKDLSAFATPSLDLDLGHGREISIPPPSASDGARLGALTTIGTAVGTGEIDDQTLAMFKELAKDTSDKDLQRLALGPALDEMIAEDWPAADIQLAATYATYYWVFGEATADAIIESQAGDTGKYRRRGRN